MYRRFIVHSLAGLALAACSSGEEPTRESRARAETDTATVTPAGGHDMHQMPDSLAEDSDAAHAAHGAMRGVGAGGAADSGHAAAHAGEHGQATHGLSEHDADDAPEMDHSRMAGGHAEHAGARPESPSAGAAGMRHDETGDHTAAHEQASTGTGQATEHAQDHASGENAAGHGQTRAPVSHAEHGQAPASVAVPLGEGTEKLLTLVQQLVQDSVVQRRIQNDPALREAWADPGVRRIILQKP